MDTLPILSRTPQGLRTIYITSELRQVLETTTFKTGQKVGQSYRTVLERDPSYLVYLKNNLKEEVKSPVLQQLLDLV
jgi:hypothetical protein